MKPALIREIATLKHWSELARIRNCKPLNFNGYKPAIKKLDPPTGGWICEGLHPDGVISYGWGPTPGAAYESWTDNIPF